MKILRALDRTEKAIRFCSPFQYVAIDGCGVLHWFDSATDTQYLPVSMIDILDIDWEEYHPNEG